jgi:hypothetical protein
MKNKILVILVCMTFFMIVVPTTTSFGITKEKSLDNMGLCHVKIMGQGEVFLIGSNFRLGLGRSSYMRVELESGSIEIKNIMDSSEMVLLDGPIDINIFGFIGYFNSQIRINGFGLLSTW